MDSRSRSVRQGARALFAGGVVAFGLFLDPAGLPTARAQEAAGGAAAKEKPPVATSPETRLREQRFRTRKARIAYEIARLNREIAEIAAQEYPDVIYPRDLASVEHAIRAAESDLFRAEDRSQWARRMFEKGYVSQATRVSEELNLAKAKFALEQAQAKKKLLVDYTRAKTVKALQVGVEKARGLEEDRKAEWEREVIQQAELERILDRT